MLTSMNTGVSALDQFQQNINVIANNIANVNTTGFKGASVDFEDTLSQTMGSNAAGSMQVGTGVGTASITNDFTAGTINNTGVQTDMAISGNGFFVVQNATGGNYYTQDGAFSINTAGNLVTSNGLLVQGLSGPIQFPTTTTPSISSYTIGQDGTISVLMSDNTTTTAGQIALQNFLSPTQLVKAGGNLYTAPLAAGALAAPVAPGASGTGTIKSGFLEMSNVDLASQLTALISVQRAYEANAKIITTSDEMLQDVNNLKR